jgi:hypothetical protein
MLNEFTEEICKQSGRPEDRKAFDYSLFSEALGWIFRAKVR